MTHPYPHLPFPVLGIPLSLPRPGHPSPPSALSGEQYYFFMQ